MILLLGSVNCGNHRASSCTRCPQGNGRLWCNGECKWYGVWGCGPNRLRNEKSTESKNYSLYDWLFSTNSSPSAEAKGKLNPIKPVSISTAILGECKAGAPIEILRNAF